MGADVVTRKDGGEMVPYNYEGYPVRAGMVSLAEHAGNAVGGHWHEELEFALVEKGSLFFEVCGTIHRLGGGEGIFINARRSHRVFSEGQEGCRFLLLQAHPVLLCASRRIEERFVLPFLSGEEFPYVLLRGGSPWERQVLDGVGGMCRLLETEEGVLESQGLLSRIWLALYQNLFRDSTALPHSLGKARRLTLLREMVGFIQENYPQKLRLEDIARAAGLQKTACTNLFKHYLGEPPISYLTKYRLQAGARLLRTTTGTVTDITYAVGFSSASYFVRAFRGKYHCTPLQYRAAHSGEDGPAEEDGVIHNL